jgi:hypothetical protein
MDALDNNVALIKAFLYLALNVYFAEGRSSELFEVVSSFPQLHTELLVALVFNNTLGTVRLEEFTAHVIVVEAELVSKEAKRDGRVTTEGQPASQTKRRAATYPFDILARAVRRSRSMNMSIR